MGVINTNNSSMDVNVLPSSFRRAWLNHWCGLCTDISAMIPDNVDMELLLGKEEQALEHYLDWLDTETIAAFCEVTPTEVLEHAKAFKWDVYRSKDTRRMYQAIIREAVPEILANPADVPAKDLLRIAKQLDVITGREIGKAENSVFDDRAIHTMMTTLQDLVHKGHQLDTILPVFERELPGITEIYKRKFGLAKIGVTIQDVSRAIDSRGDLDE